MPKLLQINITANWGSTGRIAEQIGSLAQKRGWDSYIAYGRYSNSSQSHLIKVGSIVDSLLHFVMQSIFDNEGLNSKRATQKLVCQIKEINPDIVHLHNIHDHYLNYKILFTFLNQTQIKVVWTFHDFWAITGHCMHFVTKECSLYKKGCHECPMRKVYPKTLMDNSKNNYEVKKCLFTANSNLTIVPVSNWVADIVKNSFLKDNHIRVIPNGIDLKIFQPTDLTTLEAKFSYKDFLVLSKDKFIIIGVASQWNYDKGLNDYIKLSKKLAEDEIIVLVGINNKIIKKLPSNIVGIKRTSDQHELAALYSRANVVTNLSNAETFGLTIVEGYACGTPAVVYDNTAPPSLITKQTGLVVETNNVDELYNAISIIRNHGDQYYYANCIQLAKEKYDKEKCYNQYIELYEELIK